MKSLKITCHSCHTEIDVDKLLTTEFEQHIRHQIQQQVDDEKSQQIQTLQDELLRLKAKYRTLENQLLADNKFY